MRNVRCVPLVCLFLCLTACAHLQVGYDVAESADLKVYKTYGWLTAQPKDNVTAVLFKDIQTAIRRELSAKGLKEAAESPELLIAVHNTTSAEIQVSGLGYNYSPADYWGSWGGYWGPQVLNVHRYGEGTLVLDLVDPKTKQLAWRGWANNIIDMDKAFKKRVELADRAIHEILEKFPPPPHHK